MKIPQNWTFKSEEVAANFDTHVREQLPWYELATTAVSCIAKQYIPDSGLVYDIGASTGNIGRALNDVVSARNVEFIPIESSKEMASKYSGPGKPVITDAYMYDFKQFDVAICFLVLMFMAVNNREPFIRELKKKIKPGGALIILDKTEPCGGYASVAMHRLTLAGKLAAGASPKEILDKELSLSGCQRPLNINEIDEGATEFFRFGDFAGWIIE